ncbi:hypothetical protein H9P43_006959 [Blastocladiella emersonii ATCC 22665]|nr:hypothetical protein H9P43_006959 [Blastocladiella emersonii ATCC 22665]
MDAASARGAIGVLDKWRASGLPLAYSHETVMGANGKSFEAMEWWGNSGLPFTHPQCPGGSIADVLNFINLGYLTCFFPDC